VAGPTGATGPEGPQLKTQTGVWSSSGRIITSTGDIDQEGGGGQQFLFGFAAISFTAPLTSGLDAAHVHFVKLNELVEGCAAGTVANPKAEPGHLCVYLGKAPEQYPGGVAVSGVVTGGTVLNPATGAVGAAKTGARVLVEGDVAGMTGTWAMTLP
jgi:hypothetical protein